MKFKKKKQIQYVFIMVQLISVLDYVLCTHDKKFQLIKQFFF